MKIDFVQNLKICEKYCFQFPTNRLCFFVGQQVHATCGHSSAQQKRIVYGYDSLPNAWPWMASIQRGSNHWCGATLVSPTWVGRLLSLGYLTLGDIYILLHGFRVHTIFIHEVATFHERSREALRPSE